MDKQELIEELERFEAFAQVDRSEYWIECGGVMLLHGLRDQTSGVDITVSSDIYDRILDTVSKDDIVIFHYPKTGGRPAISGFSYGMVDVHPQSADVPTIEVVKGFRCTTLAHVVLMKQQMNRPKDLVDIATIEEFCNGI